MATVGISKSRINGVVDTTATALENLSEIAFNAGAWMTWDPTLGKWSIVVNESQSLSGARVFDDSNILGSINMTFSGAESMYNAVRINYPHKDLRNARDEIYFSLAAGDRYFGEYDNELSISTNLITDPVQAAYIGSREMKQSRIDAVVEFKTDYTAMDLEVGEVFLLKNDTYNFNNGSGEYFRCVNIEEIDTEEGGIILSVTALQYDGGVYTQSGLVREERNLNSGIVPAQNNVCKVTNDDESFALRTGDALATPIGREAITSTGVPLFFVNGQQTAGSTIQSTFNSAYTANVYGMNTGAYPNPFTFSHYYGYTWQTLSKLKYMTIQHIGPQAAYNYVVDGSTKSITAGIPQQVNLYSSLDNTNWTFQGLRFMEWSTYQTNIDVSDVNVAGVYWFFQVVPLNTYDLNATNNYIKPTQITTMINFAGTSDAAGITIIEYQN